MAEREGCDCAELCSMGPTCPGGMLARLPGSGCHRTTAPEEQAAEVLARHRISYHSRNIAGDTASTLSYTSCEGCDWLGGWHDEAGWEAHLAAVLAPLLAEAERRRALDEAVRRLDAEVESEVARLGGVEVVRASGLLNNWVGGLRAAANVLRSERADPKARASQTWERRIPGTDVPLQRLHLDIDDTGRAVIHEAVLGPLLLEGGWQRTT